MKIHRLTFSQILPVDPAVAWDFFSSPLNLEQITPDDMPFVVTSPFDGRTKMYAGMLITYKVAPLFGIRLDWMTEITHMEEGTYFVDEQRFGPFGLWHHCHRFETVPGGVRMTDILHYGVGYGFVGRIADRLLVARKVREIFAFRHRKAELLFGKPAAEPGGRV